MRYCRSCGAPVHEDAVVCGRCGAATAREKSLPSREGRGLKLAIGLVAFLWVVTAALWMLWPRLSREAAPGEDAGAVLSGGLSQTLISTPAPAPTTEAVPMQLPSPSPAKPTPSPTTAPARAADRLELFTWWWGYLFLNNGRGSSPLESDVTEVWGYIGFTDDQRAFFEIYDTREIQSDTVPLVSYYIDLYDDHFVPVVGDKDAWVLDRYLDQGDVEPLTLYLADGKLKLNYHYEVEGTSCDLYCLLMPEG